MHMPETLHKALLAGTSRIQFDAAAAVSPALQELTGQAGGQQLWLALAAQDLWQRAGFKPAGGTEAPAAAGVDEECPRAAEEMLQLIMRGIQPGLLPIWLSLAQARAVTLPHVCLVPLLEQAMTKPGLREKLLPVLGARGRWLVAQNPEWAAKLAVGAEDVESTWNTGSPAERAAALRSMRIEDPAAALARLQSCWAQEPPENRASLLPSLEQGLSLADEAFLEAALDDKRKEVRSVARELLGILPGSQLSARCAARLDALFTLHPGSFGRLPVLELALPEACDKAMKRDGAGIENPHRLGEKQCWIFNLMQCVPPAHWSARWNLPPGGVMQVFAASDFRAALLHGLVHAVGLAARSGAPQADELFIGIHSSNTDIAATFTNALAPLAMALPPAGRERVLHAWLERPEGKGVPAALALAEQMAGEAGAQLSPATSRLLLARVQQLMRDRKQVGYGSKQEFDALAVSLDVGDLDYLEQGWPEPGWLYWENWRQLVDGLKETLRFRNTLQRSFMDDKE